MLNESSRSWVNQANQFSSLSKKEEERREEGELVLVLLA